MKATADIFTEDDLELLSTILRDDPFANEAHESVEYLYILEWIETDQLGKTQTHYIWYVAEESSDLIYVVAHSTQKDDDHNDDGNLPRAKKFARWLSRLLYAGYRIWQNWNDDDFDGPNLSDYGP